jgi:penicillin-binding protein 1A
MKLRLLIITIFSLFIGSACGFLIWSISDLPELKSLESFKPSESSFIYSSDGVVLAELYIERRNFIPHYNIPDHVKKALIAIEDQRFYSHPGVDILGILRAVYKDLVKRDIVEGGSTITQQLSKMLFLRPEKTITRKIKEAIISAQIEKKYTKEEILGMYLNQAYFGTRAYGIEAAAQTYFGKETNELTIAEAALLAGLLKAPSKYSPFKNPENAIIRRRLVLKNMLDNGFISKEQFDRANLEPLPLKPNFRRYEAPYFIELLRQNLEFRYGDSIYKSGFKIYSTIDFKMQKAAERAISKGIEIIEKRTSPGIQASLVAIDIKNGNIKAMVGGNDFWKSQYNRATQALRQPGSAFKPFVYAAAILNGMHAEDIVLDKPVSFKGAKPNSLWSPKNYDNEYHGNVTLKKALALSLNAATVRLAYTVGINKVIDIAKQCGIKSSIPPYLPIALGAADVTPMELTHAYSVLATGKRFNPSLLEKIVDRNGSVIETNQLHYENILPQEVVEEMKTLLKEVVETGTAVKAKELKRTIYGKTGTTNDYSDAWFIGFDDSLVVGVWVGRDNHKPIGNKETGARAALPIWIDFMKEIYKN